jgi:hypothetical protein
VHVTWSILLLRGRKIGHSGGTRLQISVATSKSNAIIVSSIVLTVVTSVAASVSVTSCDHVGIIGCVVAAVSPLLAAFVVAISSVTRVIRVSPIVFIVITARARLSHVFFAINPTVHDFHQLGDGFRLQVAELLDVGFPSDAATEGVDFPVDGKIFGCIQELGEAPGI